MGSTPKWRCYDRTIVDDPDWSRYMMANRLLREQLTGPAQEQAQQALRDFLAGNGQEGTFDRRFAAEIENGEGIVGYQYLHGTNTEVGGFQFGGNTTVRPQSDGSYQVTINGEYTWNDVIDPNPQTPELGLDGRRARCADRHARRRPAGMGWHYLAV